jgi:hypothetical protein
MNKLTILLLFSAIALTLVLIALIPQMIIPEDEENGILYKKPAALKTDNSESIPSKTTPSGDNDCDLAAYGLDCAITSYLEKNATFTIMDGKSFCDYETLRGTGNKLYLTILCEEFYLKDGKIYEGSGTAGPAKITKEDGQIAGIWRPRDGSLYTPDMQANFPADLQGMNPDTEKMGQINRERAKNYFNADFSYQIERTTDVACSHDFECATPGEYLMMSRCPFTSMCLAGKCTVICPDFYNIGQ